MAAYSIEVAQLLNWATLWCNSDLENAVAGGGEAVNGERNGLAVGRVDGVNMEMRFARVARVADQSDGLPDPELIAGFNPDTTLLQVRQFHPHALTGEDDVIACWIATVGFGRRLRSGSSSLNSDYFAIAGTDHCDAIDGVVVRVVWQDSRSPKSASVQGYDIEGMALGLMGGMVIDQTVVAAMHHHEAAGAKRGGERTGIGVGEHARNDPSQDAAKAGEE